jgi:hypothetical protein
MAGLLLLIVTAVAWYDGPGGSVSAWEAFDVTDVVLGLAGATALLFGIAGIARPTAAFPVPASSVIAGIGFIAGVLVVIRLFDPPADLTPEPGAWLGLAACAAIATAGWYGMGEEPEPSPGA